jgi:hypothetical protein
LTLLLTVTLGALAGIRGVSATDPNLALEALPSKDFTTLLQAPNADWAHFEAVHVTLPEVSFRKNWQRDQNRYDSFHVRDRDVERLGDDMAGLVREVLQEQFAGAGWRLADKPGPGVLVLQPRVLDLDITAPDVPGNALRETYTDSAGSMTLELTISDGASGALLLQAADHREDPRDTVFEWRKRPGNLHRARLMVRGWARDLTELLGSR